MLILLVRLKACLLAFSLITLAVSTSKAETLKNAVQYAVEEHPSRLAARANVQSSANNFDGTRRSFLPKVELYGDIGVEKTKDHTGAVAIRNTLNSRQLGVSASLTLFDGYERANLLYRNSARLDQSLFELLSSSETVALDAVEAYIDLVRHYRLRKIAKDNISHHRKILRQIKARVDGGKSPISDLYQMQERVFAAEAVEIEIEKALADAKSKYKATIGRAPIGNLSVPSVKGMPNSAASLVKLAMANNTQIKAASSALAAASYERDASKGANKPVVSLEGRVTSSADRNGTPGVRSDAYIGLQLKWNLFDGGVQNSQTASLAAQTDQIWYQRENLLRSVRQNAERAYTSLVQESKRNNRLAKQVESNQRIVKNYREEYELSKRSLLDVLDAERALFNTKFQQISVQSSQQFASYRILAVQSKLASYFGISRATNIEKPSFEQQAISSGQSIFDIDIQPLK